MNFNSLAYAIFLPIVFITYWLLPHKYRWLLLLLSSYYFYMSWNPKYVVLILLTTTVSYVAALLMEKQTNKTARKPILALTLAVCVGVLFFFKYFNFAFANVAAFFNIFSIHLHPITLNLLLPVGISFYTFQTLSYVIDVYQGKVKPEKHFGVYATFISFFPQLVAGPIERTNNLLPQITSKKEFDYDLAMLGVRQMLWGFFKKIAVADVVAVYVDAAYKNLHQCTGLDLCFAIFFFTIQIYCDFSGYSDIAIGTARLFGINLMTNFASPYFATSVKEFWSRWHISLSTWFRDYVYIPMGGSRCSKIRNSINIMVTFLISGLWHGANWTFVFWGGIHGLAQVIEKVFGLGKKERGKFGKVLSWFVVFLFCNLAWVFFRADSFADALYVIQHAIPGIGDIGSFGHINMGPDRRSLRYILAVIFLVAVYDYATLKHDVINVLKNKKIPCLVIEYVLVCLIIVAMVNGTGSNQFVYFQF